MYNIGIESVIHITMYNDMNYWAYCGDHFVRALVESLCCTSKSNIMSYDNSY